jgi:type I restriction enzyme S subunit
MSLATEAPPRAFAVWFKDLRLWSVGSFARLQWQWPKEYVRPLSEALCRRVEEVDRKQHAIKDLQLVTLHFDGSMEPRDLDGQKSFKGKLFFAFPDDVVYSRIDVRNRAIGVVPPEMPKVAVSGKYPVYKVSSQVALPAYVKLLFRTDYFRRTINSMISGASGRKRVQPEQLEGIKVPLPPVSVQRVIVEKWENAQREIIEAQRRVEQLKVEIEARFLRDLGLTPPQDVARAKYFGVWWKDFPRWSVTYNQAALAGADLSQGRYPAVDLGSVLELVQYGTSEKANTKREGVPILRMNNIVDGVLNTRDLKHIDLPEKERIRILLQGGDILFNRTNSKELVGKCAVFHEGGYYVFASYLIRLRVESQKAFPDFLAFAINSLIGRMQIDALSRQIIGQANINTEELLSFQKLMFISVIHVR